MSADLSSMTLAEAEAWRAGWREAQDAAAKASRKAWPRAHTYASENADIYIAQDHAVDRVIGAIRAMEPPA